MSYSFYKIMHLVGLFMVFSGLGAQCIHALNKGNKKHPGKKWIGIMHGLGLLLALVAGFGLIARLGLHSFPLWIYGKIAIWVILGGIGAVAARKQNLAAMILILTIMFGFLAAYLAVLKPM